MEVIVPIYIFIKACSVDKCQAEWFITVMMQVEGFYPFSPARSLIYSDQEIEQ
jgi:hypothetical protein